VSLGICADQDRRKDRLSIDIAMSFADLPPLPPLIHPDGAAYAQRIMAATRAVQARWPVAIDQPYGSDYWQKVDVYWPGSRISDRLPVLCFLHGGAWINGCKEWLGFMAPPLLDLPAIFVAVSYRHAPESKFPSQLNDTVDALAWVFRNIGDFGGDPRRIYLGGHSSGGHLAALAAMRPDAIADSGLPSDVIRACLPISAPFDLASDDPVRQRKVAAFLSQPEDIAPASPIHLLAGNKVPFLITFGSADLPELIPQAKQMAAALRGIGAPIELLELPSRDHFATHEECGLRDGMWVKKVRAILKG
jgi:arylformamidase